MSKKSFHLFPCYLPPQVKWSSGGHVQLLRYGRHHQQILSGGRENDVKLWDVGGLSSAAEPVFSAKNVRPDELCVRRPIWVTDGRFLPDGRRVVVTTGGFE